MNDRLAGCVVRQLLLAVMLFVSPLATSLLAAAPLSFNRDIRPLLAEYCWKCHGFDEHARQAGLRLDDRQAAVSPRESGLTAIVPGHPEQSELIVRLTSDDPDLRMPPVSTGKQPTSTEIERLKQWIAAGAPYQQHWSFEPITRPAIPDIAGVDHPVDAFIVRRLAERGMTPAPEAERDILIRRVYFDLIGLPPTLEELELARHEPWAKTIDRLLASPHFGERMAVDWLDAARYADTDGYFGDKPRQMWLWRDWVIEAFNHNLPFDQFTIEQIAGDLLPESTLSQRIATGFNRNHMANDESGLIDEEYRVEYVNDRVETTMSTWLGLTIGCAQCHDHKYDPISQREYYQLFAFFNNVPEKGLLVGQNAPPRIAVPSASQLLQLPRLEAATAAAIKRFESGRTTAEKSLADQESDILAGLAPLPSGDGAIHLSLDGHAEAGVQTIGTALKPTPGVRGQGLRFDATQHLEYAAPEFPIDGPWTLSVWLFPEKSLSSPVSKIEPTANRRGMEIVWRKGRVIVNLVHRWEDNAIEVITREKLSANHWQQLVVRYDGTQCASGLQLFFNGRPVDVDVVRDSLTGTIVSAEPLRIARRDEGLGYYGALDEFRWIPRAVPNGEVLQWFRGEHLRGILERPANQRTARDADWLLDDYIDHQTDEQTRTARDAVRAAQAAEQTLRDAIPTTLVMEEQASVRPTHVLIRGVYNQPGDRVQPDIPASLTPWPAEAPRNRLGLARWLMAPDNPLVARVAVNRLWQQCFGDGLVRTAGDFGTQGEPPLYPELIDFLAATYRDSGWDTKALLKLIVTSRTYRQDSRQPAREQNPSDPENRLLARGPRFRLSQEMIRDQALVVSGLLVPVIGGPSVKPYQPPGLWEDVSYDGESTYEIDDGAGRYRRSLYTFHKRQAPPPALMVFDGPTREKCTLKRPRTNTPLQALVLLNDKTYVDAACLLAGTLLLQPETDRARIERAVCTILNRESHDEDRAALQRLLDRTRQRYSTDRVAAKVLTIGHNSQADEVEFAAWSLLVHTLLNLDEAITRR